MDSIKGSHSGLKNLLQSYLLEEWKERHPEAPEEHSSKFSNLRFVPLELPQQENSFDCGLFLLHYVELFLEEAPLNFSPFKITKLSKFLSLDWFSPSEASFKRYVIRKLIYDLLNYPSQKVNSSTFCNGDLSLGDCQDVLEQEPAVKFLSEQCSISKMVVGNSVCFAADGENQMNHVTLSSLGASLCDKQEGLLLKDFFETEATSTSSPKHQDNSFEDNAPSKTLKSPTCPIEESAHEIQQFMSSSPEKNNDGSFGECQTTEICSTSCYLKQDGVQEKESSIDLLPRTLSSGHEVSDQRGEKENAGSVLLEDCGYVPDISTSSSTENQENASQEIVTSKTEYSRNCENSDRIKATEATIGSGEERQEIDTIRGEVGRTEDPQEIASIEAEEGDILVSQVSEDTSVAKNNSDGEHQEINTNVAKSNCAGERQEINTTEVEDGGAKDSKEIGNGNAEEVQIIRNYEAIEDTSEAESVKGEENQVIDTEEYKDGNSEDCQRTKLSGAGEAVVENSKDCQVVDPSANVKIAGDCQVVGPSTAEAVDIEDCKIVDTSEVEGGDFRSPQQISSTVGERGITVKSPFNCHYLMV
ncbi:putative ubiquitin-like-specific protease 2B [Iris pallida]|uniref:Ubiquitin-like-specific protease 2B n=1 Tax=Iris pallida TaxID=29817 RepID=A0AAX6GVP9_IRIPA|nr:putative ubiquitin-like-specific protease 2B [Iris pallida]